MKRSLHLSFIGLFLLFAAPFQAQDFLISQGGSVTTCGASIYDSGGSAGNYANSENFSMTFCAEASGECLSMYFLAFNIENFWDSLIVYDGPAVGGPILGAYSGILDPFSLSAPGSCVTIRFESDGSVVLPGFQIALNCVCPSCDDGVWNGEEVAVDCGGPDCPECDFNVISEGGTVTGCDITLFDSGINGQYTNNENYTMTFCGETPGECLQLDFTNLNIANGDNLRIYDGLDASGFQIANLTNITNQASIVAPGTCVTFVFTSDGFTTAAGFEINMTCGAVCSTCEDGILNGYEIGIDCGGPDCEECDFIIMGGTQTESSCETTIYDNGLFEPYENGSDDLLTICSDTPGECMQLEFLSFNIESGWDFMSIYAGPDMNSPLVGTFTGTEIPQYISPGTECVTIHFTSDGIINAPGYEIAVSCMCPSCDDGIINGQEIGVDCGGPDCEECDFIIISQGGVDTTCSSIIYDSGLFGNYQNNEFYVLTVCADDSASCLSLDFLFFDIENFYDSLIVYAGTDITGPIIGQYSGVLPPFSLLAPGSCVTFKFTSDASVVRPGFEIAVSCMCPSCDDGILNGFEIDTDCGGPDCPDCPFYVISEGSTVIDCAAVLLDAGVNGNYGNNQDYTMTFCGDDFSQCLSIGFPLVDIGFGDHLYVYDGIGTGGFLIADLTNTTAQGTLTAPSSCVTFRFTSDGFTTAAGFEANITCDGVCPSCDDGIQNGYEIGIDCGGPDCPECPFIIMNGNQTEASCSTTIYDNGYDAPYANGSNDILTICSDSPGSCMQLEFISFDIESGWDFMSIYAGSDISAPLIGTYTGTVIPQFISSGGECLTIQFTSDVIINAPGYEIEVSCVCPSCDDGILNGEEIGIDCGGPDCEECDFILISNEVDITGCSGTVFDSGLMGNYQVSEDYSMTICAEDTSTCIVLDFASFQTEGNFDFLNIYEGTDMSGAQVASFTGSLGAFTFNAPYSCITLNFISDNIVTAPGFQFDISCGECPVPTEQDCLGANDVCENVYVQESYPPAAGNFPVTLPPGSCLDNAQNVIWYTFTVQEAGNLSFSLTPESATDDYDWALFDLSNASCEDISSSPELIVSCNSFGLFGESGPTGISTSNGGIGNVNGPGDLNGPPFNADYPVLAGQTFALLVQNWTGSFDGYTLDFSETTAGIFYPGGPDITSITPHCNWIDIVFSEPVSCDSLDSGDFLIQSESTVYVVDSLLSDCDFLSQAEIVRIYVTPHFPDFPEEVTIAFNPDQSLILDLCGNPVPTDTAYVFETIQWISLLNETIPTECTDEIGSLEILFTYGEGSPYTYLFEGEPMPANLLVENLGAGLYLVDVTDIHGCHLEQEVFIDTDILEIDLLMPNVFSPNKDEENELFGPIAVREDNGEQIGLVNVEKYMSKYDLRIYNRWGKEVFFSTGSRPFWDGKSDGSESGEGTYFYVLNYTEDCTLQPVSPKSVKGTLTLLR